MIRPEFSISNSLVVSLCGLLLCCILSLSGCSQAAAPDDVAAQAEQQPVPVQAVTVEPKTLRPGLDLVGTLLAIPERTAVVSPQLGGWVTKLSVVEGQSIQAGDVLVQLDDRAAKADVERAKALVAEKSSALARLKSGYLPQELETARQDRDKLQASVEALRTELTALEDLLKRRELSPVQYESKAKALKSAEAALASADSHLKLVEAGTRPELIEEAQALLEAANVDVEHAQLTLDWCTIRSPIGGVVVQLLAHQGQFFDRAVPLATVMDLSELFAQLRIPGREFSKIAVGTKVDVEMESLPGQKFVGAVTRISGQADPLTGNVIVFALLKNPDSNLRPGLSCQARVWLPEIPHALAVPASAVGDHSGTPVVTIIRDNKAYETEVELGVKTRDLVQISKGVSAGDVVATAGGYGLPEGCPVLVQATETNSPASEPDAAAAPASEPRSLRLVQTIALPKVKGGFDLMAADVPGERLFAAAQDNNTVEVLDLRAGQPQRSLAGFKQPKGILYRPEANRLYVSNGGDGTVHVLDAQSFQVLAVADFKEKANNLRYDSRRGLLYVGCGESFGAIGILNVETNAIVGEIKLDAFPKQFALEQNGSRIFANVPTTNEVAVVDRDEQRVVAKWPVREEKDNVPLAYDEQHQQLLIGCEPGQFVSLNTQSGKTDTHLAIAPEPDGISFDSKRERVYISCGAGSIEILHRQPSGEYTLLEHLPTEAGAATSLFVPEWDRLFLAVPQREQQSAEIRVYQTQP